MKMKLFAFFTLFITFSCSYSHKVVFQNNEKQETRAVTVRSSDNLTVFGRTHYSDSATGRTIKKVRYRSKVGKMSSHNKKYVTINFDSVGKRTGKTRAKKVKPGHY
jgi:hypothetical protein